MEDAEAMGIWIKDSGLVIERERERERMASSKFKVSKTLLHLYADKHQDFTVLYLDGRLAPCPAAYRETPPLIRG